MGVVIPVSLDIVVALMAMDWLRLWVDVIDDEKLKLLAFEDRWHYIAILCMKRKGMLDAPDTDSLRDRKVGAKLGLGDHDRDQVRQRLTEVGLLDERWQPLGWGKRQFVSDGDPTATQRKRKQRDRDRHVDVTRDIRDSHGRVTDESLEGHTAQISDSEKIKIGQTAFDQFWSVYPKKVKRKTSAEIWNRKRLDSKSGELIADVQRRLESDRRWREGFIPDPTTYLNQERWGDALEIVKRPRVEGL